MKLNTNLKVRNKKIPDITKSGVYQIKRNGRDETSRENKKKNIITRFNEHLLISSSTDRGNQL